MKNAWMAFSLALLTSCAASRSGLAESSVLLSGPEMKPVYFKRGHPMGDESLLSALDGEYSVGAMNDNIVAIKAYERLDFRYEIDGFTDNEECSDKKCGELSMLRANSVYEWLLKNGISKSSLSEPIGHGAEMPIGDNRTDAGRSSNRRVDVTIVP